jgi:hypothetical protein
MRERLLVRHFFTRFLEHDLISVNADRHEVLAMTAGTLVTFSLFAAVLIGAPYQFTNTPPGMTLVLSLDDRLFLMASSMLILALVAVAQWDALSLDARDAAVLGVLPIPRKTIVRAKFAAVALLAIGAAAAWNVPTTLLRFVAVPIGLPVGLGGVVRLTLAQGLVSIAAGAFGFLAVYGLREGLAAVLGHQRFRAISSALQAMLLVVLASSLLLLPGASRNAARDWFVPDSVAMNVAPPLWFVALHEAIAGSVIDEVPNVWVPKYLADDEARARELYRSRWPEYRRLAPRALGACAIVILVTIAASLWNSRRLPTAAFGPPRSSLSGNRIVRGIVARAIAPFPLSEAGFWFALQTVPRRANHRVVMATAVAVGLAALIMTVGAQMLEVHTTLASVPLAVLAAQSMLLIAVLTGFRQAAQVPADYRASTTFAVAMKGDTRWYVAGVKRAAWVGVVLPTLLVLSIWHAVALGPRVAVLHGGLGTAVALLTIEALFFRNRRLAYVSAYVPALELRSHGVAYVVGVMLFSFGLAAFERLALGTVAGTLVLVGVVTTLGASLAAMDRIPQGERDELLIEEAVPTATVRLNLAG